MLELYKLLSDIIEPICTCFVGHYPTEEEKIYPYIEIRFPTSIPNNSFSDNNLLEVDIWDNKDTDIREVEGITNSIHKKLNRSHYITDIMQVSVSRNNPYRLEPMDPQIGIQRRQLRYIVKVYYK
jgi:hypothetical protein